MFAKMAANLGFNSFRALASSVGGMGQLRTAGKAYMHAGRAFGAGRQGAGRAWLGLAGRTAVRWGGAAGNTGARRGAISAARIGGATLGAGAAADFLNPWGLGWGD